MSGTDWSVAQADALPFGPDDGRSYEYSQEGPTVAEFDPSDDTGRAWGSAEYIPVKDSSITEYNGAYEAGALFVSQTFPTANRLMTDDFKVRAINYTEAPNDYGTTVTIGG